MIKLSMVAVPATDDRLATIRQIGVENVVHLTSSVVKNSFERSVMTLPLAFILQLWRS